MTALPMSVTFATRIADALGWPGRALEARRTRAQLAELSERELRDIGGVREGADQLVPETDAERRARLRAIRAWYGHNAKAA